MEYFGLTDKGRVRPTNQDIYQIEAREENQTALLVVCDGMGGANAGNVASRFAAQAFTEVIGDALNGPLDARSRQDLLTRALDEANRTVFTLAGRQPEFRGMGTTLVAALVQGSEATVINVGDSRAYLFDGVPPASADRRPLLCGGDAPAGSYHGRGCAHPSAEKSDYPCRRRRAVGRGRSV